MTPFLMTALKAVGKAALIALEAEIMKGVAKGLSKGVNTLINKFDPKDETPTNDHGKTESTQESISTTARRELPPRKETP